MLCMHQIAFNSSTLRIERLLFSSICLTDINILKEEFPLISFGKFLLI